MAAYPPPAPEESEDDDRPPFPLVATLPSCEIDARVDATPSLPLQPESMDERVSAHHFGYDVDVMVMYNNNINKLTNTCARGLAQVPHQ